MTKVSKNYRPWLVKEEDFPSAADIEEQLKFLINYAILAPSAHNTQPWQFSVEENTISLYADFDRWLPAVDPEKRELYISVGCALCNILVASEHFGFAYKVNVFPKKHQEYVVAIIEFNRSNNREKMELSDLFAAIKKRHTNRKMYDKRPIADTLLNQWRSFINDDDIHIDFLTGVKKDRLGKLTNRGYQIAFSDKNFREELGTWTHHNWTRSKDGMPLFGMNLPLIISFFGPYAFKRFKKLGTVLGKINEKQVESAPVVGVISAKYNKPFSWVRVGEYFERIVLDAARKGIRAGVLAASIEERDLYKEVQQLLSTHFRPQMVFRLGYVDRRPPHAPRRSAKEVMK